VFLVNSRFPLVSAAHTRSTKQVCITGQAPLLPKLRGHFAEFLNHNSLDRLGILYLITCVGLGYGRLKPRVDAFLGSIGSPDPPIRGSHQISGSCSKHTGTDLPIPDPTSLDRGYHRPARLPSCVTPVNTLASRDQVPAPAQPSHHKWRNKKDRRWLVSPAWHGRFFAGTGISTRCPSTTPVGLALGPDLPRAD
jgi:hypothetical protein